MTTGGRDRRARPSDDRGIIDDGPGTAELRAAVFGVRLRELRITTGMSLEELASAADLELGLYRRLEDGTLDLDLFTVDKLFDLTDALGSNPREFFKGLD